MKRTCLFFAAVAMAAFAASAQATTFFSDTFSYDDGDLTAFDPTNGPNGTGDNVSGGVWLSHNGGNLFPIPVGVSSGQAVVKSGNPAFEDVSLSSNFRPAPINAGETWYYAALVTVNDERADSQTALNNDYFMHFIDDGFGFRGRAYVDDPNAGVGEPGFTFGLSATSGGQVAAWPNDLTFGEQYKIVVSYAVDTGESNLWVDPVDINSPSIQDINPAGAFTLIDSLALRQDFSSGGGDHEILVDSVAFGNDFASVVENAMNGSNIRVPEPAGIALVMLGLAGFATKRRR